MSHSPFYFLKYFLKCIVRLSAWLIGLLLAATLVISLGVWILFDPNDYKSSLAAYVTGKTGLALEIEGALHLRVFPWLGLEANHIALAQAPGFGEGKFVQIDKLGFQIPLLALLRKQLIVEGLFLEGVKVQLVTQQNGQNNWEYFTRPHAQTNTPVNIHDAKPAQQNLAKKPSFSLKSLTLENFNINHASVEYRDEKNNQNIFLSKMQLAGKGLALHFPLKGEIIFNSDAVQAQGDFEGTVDLRDKNAPQIDFKSTLSGVFPGNIGTATVAFGLSGNVLKQLQIKDLRLKSADLDLTASATIPLKSQAPITFNLNMDSFDLDAFLKKAPKKGPQSPKLPTAESAQRMQTPQTQAITQKTNPDSATRAIIGEINIRKVIAKNLNLSNLKTTLKKENHNITLSPLNADFYQGRLSAQINTRLEEKQATTRFSGKMVQINIQSLLQDLKQSAVISGKADIDFSLVQENNTLSGTTGLKVQDGILEGIDIKYYFSYAKSLIKKEQTIETDTKRTPFGSLTGTFVLHDNIIDNNDLKLNSADIRAQAEGSIYLNTQSLEYKAQAWRNYNDGKTHANAYPLAIRLKGPLRHPQVEPDLDVYFKMMAEQSLKGKLDQKISRELGKLLGAPPVDEAAPENAPATPKEHTKEKIEKEINRGLKKILKF